MKGSRARLIALVCVIAVLTPACMTVRLHWGSLTRVDAPLTLRPDRRLSMVEPDQEEEVGLPVTVRWKANDFPLEDGNHFGVFIDTEIPTPGSVVRLRVCTRLEELPPAPGDFRPPCTDQRDRILFTTDTSVTLECFEPHFNRGARRMNDHTVTIVLLDKDRRRVGEAAADVPFRVEKAAAKKCRGFE